MTKEIIKKVEKVWGSEEWIANNSQYCGKILTLNPRFICSYHYHKIKDETFYVLSGLVYFKLEGKDILLREGEAQRVKRGEKHRFASLEGISRIIEFSTHHEDSDSYRETESGPLTYRDIRIIKSRLKLK